MQDNEVELVLQAQGGNKTAFCRLIEPYSAHLLAFHRSHVRNAEDADDLAQQTVLAALERIGTLADPGRFRSWFWGIAWHKMRDWLKNPIRREISLSDLERFDMSDQSVVHCGLKIDLWDEVDHLLAHHREVIRLRYGAGLSLPEIANLLEPPVAVGTVNKWLGEARKRLRQRWRSGEDSEFLERRE